MTRSNVCRHVLTVFITSTLALVLFVPTVPANADSDRIILSKEAVVAVLPGYSGDLTEEDRASFAPGPYGRTICELFVSFLQAQFGARAQLFGPEQVDALLRAQNSPKAPDAVARALNLAHYTHVITVNRASASAAATLITLQPSAILSDGKLDPGPPLAIRVSNDNGGNLPGKLTTPVANQLVAAFGTQQTSEVRKTVSIGCIRVDDQDPKTSLSWHVASRLPRELMVLYDEHNEIRIRSGSLFKLGYQLLNTQSVSILKPDCSQNGVRNGAVDAEYSVSGTVGVDRDYATGVIQVWADLLVQGPGKPIHLKPWDKIDNLSRASEPPVFADLVINDSNFVDSYIDCWKHQVVPQ